MTTRIPITVLGATGVVGQRIVRRIVAHPLFRLAGVAASPRSVGKRYADAVHWIEEELPEEVFRQVVGLLLEATATRSPKGKPDSNEGGRKGPRH
jgi:aspartate-semialdehyde dehydrogenase